MYFYRYCRDCDVRVDYQVWLATEGRCAQCDLKHWYPEDTDEEEEYDNE